MPPSDYPLCVSLGKDNPIIMDFCNFLAKIQNGCRTFQSHSHTFILLLPSYLIYYYNQAAINQALILPSLGSFRWLPFSLVCPCHRCLGHLELPSGRQLRSWLAALVRSSASLALTSSMSSGRSAVSQSTGPPRLATCRIPRPTMA